MNNRTITKSSIKAWYLTRFRQQRVLTVRYTPMLCLLGFMVYSKSWVLIAG